MTSFNSSVVLLTASPHIWRTEMTGGLGGVAVFLTEFDRDEEENLKDRRIPFMYISKASLSNGSEDYFHLGIRAAEALDCAVFAGELVVGEQR